MPPRVRFDKQAIVQAGLNVARRGGMEALNARAIARSWAVPRSRCTAS